MVCRDSIAAQISQCSDSMKRAMFYSVPGAVCSKSSLFSNMNTAYTIQSSPSRTPEVMTDMSTRSGWLRSRSDRDVWRKRWCCIVPHTLLYIYDEGAVVKKENDTTENKTPEEMEAERKKRTLCFRKDMQPLSVIDLEAYSSRRKSDDGSNVFELRADDDINPHLKPIVFKGHSEDDVDQWSDALLNHRYATLLDEKEAYLQVCEGATKQVSHWSDIVDTAESKNQILEMVNKNVRGAAEKNRVEINSIVRKTLLQGLESSKFQIDEDETSGIGVNENEGKKEIESQDGNYSEHRNDYLSEIRSKYIALLNKIENEAIGQPLASNIVDSVKILADFVSVVVSENEKLNLQIEKKEDTNVCKTLEIEEDHLSKMSESDTNQNDELKSLRNEMTQFKKEYENEKKKFVAKNLDFVMQSLVAKEQIDEMKLQNASLRRELTELRNTSKVTSPEPIEQYESQIRVEKERNNELKQKIKGLNQRVKLQSSIIDCMMNNSEEKKNEELRQSQQISDEAFFEEESIFGIVSEWTEDVSGYFPRTHLHPSQFNNNCHRPSYENHSPEKPYFRKDDEARSIQMSRNAYMPNTSPRDSRLPPTQESFSSPGYQNSFAPDEVYSMKTSLQRGYNRRVSSLDL